MKRNWWVISYRLAISVAVLAAVVTQISAGFDRGNFNPSNFFSFFTIQSNLFAVGVLLYGLYLQLKGRKPSKTYDLVRGAAVLYMSVTGVVFALLLSHIQADLQLTLPWVDTVLHKLMPLFMVLDWVVVPPAKKLVFTQIKWWLIYPIVYLFYSLIRGPIVDWYPYPFLDPDKAGGYGGIALYALGIAAGTIAMGSLVVWSGNKLRKAGK